jgi:hypothetical protein
MTEVRTRQRREVGEEFVNANGYTQVKTADRGWVAKHILLAEQRLGRPVDPKKEMVKFDDGDRRNLHPDNIKVVPRGKTTLRKRLALLEAKRDDIISEIEHIKDQLGEGT